MAWYAAHTHPGAEARALWHLERQGFSVYLPRYLKRRRHARRTDWVRAPLFPRYLFVWLDIAKQRWQAIQSTVGVSYLICGDGEPLAVPEQIIDALRVREDGEGLISLARQSPFRAGEQVQVTDGALVDQIGIFQCSSGSERAVILLSLLGRDLKVTVLQTALSRAA
jgi:transcriptional antiterminator RfaH